jgi:TPR repeat protein
MGFGVEKDFTAAKKWYRRAADKSHTNALKALTRLV